MNNNEREKFSFNELVKFIYQKRRILLLLSTVSVIISFLSSLLIEDKFESTVILFPAYSNSLSKSLMYENNANNYDILSFGEEEQAEQLLQIINSDEIRNKIIRKYSLMSHYNIDSKEKYCRTKLNDLYDSNIKAVKTKHLSIEISVLDKDSVIAAKIANDIASLIDTVKSQIQQQRSKIAYDVIKNEYENLKHSIKDMEDTLKYIRSKGVIDYESQSEVFSEQYAIAVSKGDTRTVKALEEKLKILQLYGGQYVSIRDALEFEYKKMSELSQRYNEAKIDAETIFPQKFLVNKAYPADKKAYPIRWLIVLISFVSTNFLTIFLLLILNNQKIQTPWKNILQTMKF